METARSITSFNRLLECLDDDRERAGERYEDLRRTLIRFFEWRSAPFPEDQTDEVFNRLARKLDAGVEIRNVGSYCYEVARLVCLESLKSKDNNRVSFDPATHDVPATGDTEEARERELRLACLDDCLASLSTDNRELIIGYYQDDGRDRIARRKALAVKLALQREALANRAQRLRDKLEECVRKCLDRKLSI